MRDTPPSFPKEYTDTFEGKECLPSLRQITEIVSKCFENSSIQRWKNPRTGSSRSTACVVTRRRIGSLSFFTPLFRGFLVARDERLAVDAREKVKVFVGTREKFYIFLLRRFQERVGERVFRQVLLEMELECRDIFDEASPPAPRP